MLHPELRTLTGPDASVRLRRSACEVAVVLMTNAGKVMSRAEIARHLYEGVEKVPSLAVIDLYILQIRKALREAGLPPFIRTLHGEGWTWTGPALHTSPASE